MKIVSRMKYANIFVNKFTLKYHVCVMNFKELITFAVTSYFIIFQLSFKIFLMFFSYAFLTNISLGCIKFTIILDIK